MCVGIWKCCGSLAGRLAHDFGEVFKVHHLDFFSLGMGVDGHLADPPAIDFFDQCPNDFVFATRDASSTRFDPIARDQHDIGIFGIDLLGFADFERCVWRSDRGDLESFGADFLASSGREERLDDFRVAGSHPFQERTDDLLGLDRIGQIQQAQRNHLVLGSWFRRSTLVRC